MPERLLHWCQHSIGLGHLVRSLELARALATRFEVTLLSGGEVPPGIEVPGGVRVVPLPPLAMAASGGLVSPDPGTSLEQAQELRRAAILRTYRSVRPGVILTELYPFGRRRFRGELLPLLELAATERRRPVVVASVRDILVGQRADQQGHDARALEVANRHYDAVLVHADERFARLDESFGPARQLACEVVHTGFVHRERRSLQGPRRHELVVSAGGGRVGEPLLRCALQAQPEIRKRTGLRLRLVAGPFLPEAAFRALQAEVEGRDGIVLERHVDDLCGLLAGASASLSQGGYNTTLDVLQAGVPALVVPFSEGREDEQGRRARRLHELGALRVLEPARLEPHALAAAVRELAGFKPVPLGLQMDGARRSVEAIERLLTRPPLVRAV
jgi:predicted glycosyltransferase